MEPGSFNRAEETAATPTSAPGAATHDAERDLAGQVAWLGVRHVVGEIPGLRSLKQPYEKVKELMKVSRHIPDEW